MLIKDRKHIENEMNVTQSGFMTEKGRESFLYKNGLREILSDK